MSTEKIRAEITGIYKKNGSVTPEAVLEKARGENTALHSAFEWDNEKAGHLYRLVQARTLIRRIGIEEGGEVKPLIHVPAEAGTKIIRGRYVVDEDLVKSIDDFEKALAAAKRDLDAALRRIAQIRKIRPDVDMSGAVRGIESAQQALVM